jgi:hypothetical protein
MTKNEVEIGAVYALRHSSGYIHARIIRTIDRSRNNRTVTHWEAINLTTGRTIEIKSATKLRRRIADGNQS